MWDDFPLFPEQASTLAPQVDRLYFLLVGITTFFSALISVLILVFAVRYRRQKGRLSYQTARSTSLEVFWIVVPLVITMVIFVLGARLYHAGYTPPPGAMDFYVTGKQWMWKVQHPTGQREINSLHVPVGEPIRLTMSSEDVIHSFYVPAFRMKMDVVPGRFTDAWFEATRPGTYHLFCAEYCGAKHSEMRGTVTVMEPAEYELWLAGRSAGTDPVAAGAALFRDLRCDTCHGERSDARGPALLERFGSEVALEGGGTALFDEDYVRESILDPARRIAAGYRPLMPTYRGQLQEEQLHQLVAFLKKTAPAASTQ